MTLSAFLLSGAGAALAFAAILQLLHQRLRLLPALRWIARHLPLFLAGAFALWTFLLFWAAALDSLALALCISAVSFLMLGYTNYLMLYYREQPLVPRDLIMALNLNRLLTMISPASVLLIGVALLAIGGGAVWLGRHVPPMGLPASLRICLSLLCLLLWTAFCRSGRDRSPARRLFTLCGADFSTYQKSGDFIASFDSNGFIAAFFSLCLRPVMDMPPRYTQEAVSEITSAYCAKQADHPSRPHILFIMSEAFSDPLRLSGLKPSGDPIPYIRSLMQNTPSGRVLAPSYGGGTANCEFEALTGFSTTLTGGVSPYENAVYKRPGFPAIPQQLKELGYRTIALHPYKRGMYARTEAYPNMGLDSFLDVSSMHHIGTVDQNPYVSDSEAYQEVLDLLSHDAPPTFLHLVTMQNHGDYMKEGRFQTTIQAGDFNKKRDRLSAENYMQGLRHTDSATQQFLNALSQWEQEVLVVFWGDHLPGAYPPAFLQDKHREKYETPFFLWSNKGLTPQDYGSRSPMMLSSLLKEAAGLPRSPYDCFLLELQQEVHGIHPRFLVGPQDSLVPREQLSHKGQIMLEQLHLLQYDAMLGENWAAQAGFYSCLQSKNLPSQ